MNSKHGFWNLVIFLGPILFGFTLSGVAVFGASHPELLGLVTFCLAGLGFAFFLSAKLSRIIQGHLVSFGSRGMSEENRRHYRLGYVLMGVSGALAVVLISALRGPVS